MKLQPLMLRLFAFALAAACAPSLQGHGPVLHGEAGRSANSEISPGPADHDRTQPSRALETIEANDNRASAGAMRDGVLELRLEARTGTWRPDLEVDSVVTVQAFAEEGGAPRIPGPLLRATAGTEVRVRVRNTLDSILVVHGLRAGSVRDDTLHVGPGAIRELRFIATVPGTFLYWGTTTRSPIDDRPWRDSQLTGAIVIDPAGVSRDTAERIFVMTVLDVYQSDTVRNPAGEDIWELAINGRSWPHTERLEYEVGDTVRWRWLNGSYLPHPMHLHGFHFRILERGDSSGQTTFAAPEAPVVVTEFMTSGSTFRMDWVPTRVGNWLMHCHMIPHIVPFPERADSTQRHAGHDVARHPLEAMAGLVLGVTTVERTGALRALHAPAGGKRGYPMPTRHLRLFSQQSRPDSGKPARRGYVLQHGVEPRPDSVEVPGTPLVLTRGETTAITVVNRLDDPTTVHWHGMELESVFDGVAGWSGARGNLAPLLAPGDSFTVAFTPPRAGTFIYHTHMDEGAQLGTGMYGALLVLEPGQAYDPRTDITFMLGSAVVRDTVRTTLNGRHELPALELRAGTDYRLRFVNILSASAARVELLVDSLPVTWRPVAKDGADLPQAARVAGPSRLRRIGVGETFDFEWTPDRAMEAELVVRSDRSVLRQMVRVRSTPGPIGNPAPLTP